MKPPPRLLAVGLLLAGFSLALQASQPESALPGAPAEGASAVAGRPPTRKELEKQIKNAESRARRLDREAKDDERRAKSWGNRAAEAEAIGRTELAKRNRDISEGFAKDAARERQQAQEAREEAARLRQKLADLLAGRPIEGTDPGVPAPPPPKLEPDVPSVNEPTDPAQPGGPPPGAPQAPKVDVPPVVVPPVVPTSPGPTTGPGPAVPPAGCPLPAAGATTNVQTTIKAHSDNHDHSFCVLFDQKIRQVRWTESRVGTFMVRFEDLPADLNCTSTSPGSCTGQCVGRLPRVAGQENVRVTVDIDYVDRASGKFYGDLIFHFANGAFVVGFQGSDLPQAASPYPFVALAGVSLIVLGLMMRWKRRPRAVPLSLVLLLGMALSAQPAQGQRRGELTELEKVEQAEERAEAARKKADELAEKSQQADKEREEATRIREDARREAQARKSDVDLLPESPARESARTAYREALARRSRSEERFRKAIEASTKAKEEARKAEESAGATSRRAKKLRAAYQAKLDAMPVPAPPGPAPVPQPPPEPESVPEILIEKPPEEDAPAPEMSQPPLPPPAAPPTKQELEKRAKEADKRAKKLENEARDDERRANSFRRRAEDAERIGRTEQAEQNRRISEGFARDAEKERQAAAEARRQAAEARRQLADLAAGRPFVPGGGAPEPGGPVPGGPAAPGAPAEPGTGGVPPAAPNVPTVPSSPQLPVPPPPPPPPPADGGPGLTPENLLCAVPQILFLRTLVAVDLFSHHVHLSIPERIVIAFKIVSENRYAFTAEESRVITVLFVAAVASYDAARCLLTASGMGQAAGRDGVLWDLELTAESPWKGTLTIGRDGTLPGGTIVYSLEEIGRK